METSESPPLQEQLPSERSDTPTAAWLEHSKGCHLNS